MVAKMVRNYIAPLYLPFIFFLIKFVCVFNMGDFTLYQPTGYSFPYEPGDCSKKQFLLL